MEHVRLIVAIALSLLVFVAWDLLFVDRQQVPPSEETPVETTREKASKASREAQDESRPEMDANLPSSAKSFKSVTIDTGLYQAEISEQGASLNSFLLKEHKESTEPGAPMKAMISEGNNIGTALVSLGETEPDSKEMIYSTDYSGETLSVEGVPEELSFYWQSEGGTVIEKRYIFYPDSYKVGMLVTVKNRSDNPIDQPLSVSMTNPPPSGGKQFSFQGPFVYVDKKLEEIDIDDLDEKNVYTGAIQWTGIEDHYFMTALVPEKTITTDVRLNLDSGKNLLYVNYEQPTGIAPGEQQQFVYSLYLGPKQMSILNAFGNDLQEVVDFGFFGFIAKPCLWLMNAIYNNVIANYGVAIILLTLLFKAIFWPLGNKSYKSMAQMKKLQPLMAEIRKKHKDNRQKMNEEVMRLYRTYKVNPLSGCLPMVVQIPVFIAFYRMLYEAIELRHTPFLLWINDLSAPDRLFNFDVTIPFMAPPYGIPVLTIIMGATMFLQQKLSPPPGDPSQAKFMMLLPLIFTVIFINFPSGLVLYWLVNNVVSIGQQYYITRKTV